MPRLSDLLERFRRRATPPGAAGRAPGPVDARTGAEAELAEVFAFVDAVTAESEQLREDGQRRADAVAAQAATSVAAITGRIASDTAAARSAALLDRRDAGADEIAAIRHAAQREATELRERVDRALPALAEEVADTVLQAFAEDDHDG